MREIVTTPDAPPSSSPVSQATKSGGMVFIGGQMPRDPKTDKVVEGAEAQARCSMDHCLALLEAAGVGPDDVTLAIVYVTDLAAKPAVNRGLRRQATCAQSGRGQGNWRGSGRRDRAYRSLLIRPPVPD